jgi:hypothetical protein
VFVFPTYSASPASGPAPLLVHFTINATDQVVLDFGDETLPYVDDCEMLAGGCKNEVQSHTYISKGTYQTELAQVPGKCPPITTCQQAIFGIQTIKVFGGSASPESALIVQPAP